MLRKGGFLELLLHHHLLPFLALLALGFSPSAGCPVDCVCYPSPMTVSCQSHQFLTVPEGIPEESERVFLQNNRISALLRGHFSPALVTLWLYSNNLTLVDPAAFRGFVHLEELDLGDNWHLRELAPETFRGLARLHALHLYKCGLGALPSGLFRGLHSLQYLYLQDNHLEHLPDDLFADLVNLSHLFLHGNRLRALHPNTFRGPIHLDRLLLHQNRLQRVHPRAFHDLARLTLLFLFNNSLAELPGEALAPLGALEYLRLNSNPWACDCRAHSLWEWLRRFRGSSSSVGCESPAGRRGQDLKELLPEAFRACSGSESLNQVNGPPRFRSPGDRGPPRDHHPQLHASPEKGKGGRADQGYRKNCTKSRHRTTKPASLGPWKDAGPEANEEVPDYKHKSHLGLLPKPRGKCPRTPLPPPSGVQQGTRSRGSGRAGGGGRGVLWAAHLVARLLVALVVIVR